MLRNTLRVTTVSARFFSATTTRRTVKSPSELCTMLLRDHPDTLRQKVVSAFPVQSVVADAARRDAIRSRGQLPLDSASHTDEEMKKSVTHFTQRHTDATKDYVDSIVSRFIIFLQEALAKNTQQTYFDVYNAAIKDFLKTYDSASSVNDSYLAPELMPENVIRLSFQKAAESMYEEFKRTKAVENTPIDVHNHYNLSVKCSGNPGL